MEPVSVIIPTYNRAHLVPRAIRSAIAATVPQDEIIVVDDGSTDNTQEVLAVFGDRIRVIRTHNQGVGPARNVGLRAAQHSLVSFLDSDDEWTPDSLLLRRQLMAARPELVFCFSDFSNEDKGVFTNNYLVNWHRDHRDWDDILAPGVPYSKFASLPSGRSDFRVHIGDLYYGLLNHCYVPAWTSLIRKELAGDDLYNGEDMPLCEEWIMYGRLAKRGPVAYLNCDTAINHGHTGPRVTSNAGLIGFHTGHLMLAKKVWGQDPAFLAQHHDHFDRTVAAIHLRRARALIAAGRNVEARADIAAARERAPQLLRFLAAMPQIFVRMIMAARMASLLLLGLLRR